MPARQRRPRRAAAPAPGATAAAQEEPCRRRRLLGHLALGIGLVVLRPLAPELVEPSVGLGLDRAVAVEIDQQQHEQRSRQRRLQVDLAVDVQLVDLARRLRIDQSRGLVFGKLRP